MEDGGRGRREMGRPKRNVGGGRKAVLIIRAVFLILDCAQVPGHLVEVQVPVGGSGWPKNCILNELPVTPLLLGRGHTGAGCQA